MYYFLLAIGFIFVIGSVLYVYFSLREGLDSYFQLVKGVFAFLLGIFLLNMTLPSVKDMIFQDFTTTTGACTVDYAIASRSGVSYTIDFKNGEQYYFDDGPYLESYGKKHVYYCEVQHTKNEMFEVDYKIYTKKDGKLLAPEY